MPGNHPKVKHHLDPFLTSLDDAFRVRTEEEIEQEDEDPKDVEDGSATSAEKISQISYHVRSFVNCNGKHM